MKFCSMKYHHEFKEIPFADIDVFEVHEAFAGQVLSNLNAMDSDEFCRKKLNRSQGKLGRIPEGKLNTWGGSLSLGM